MSRVVVNISDQLETGVPDTGFLGIVGGGDANWGIGILAGVIILMALTGWLVWRKKRGGFRLRWSLRKKAGALASGLVIIGLVVGVSNLANDGSSEVNAVGEGDRLSVSADDVVMNVVLQNDPAYVMVENKIKVEEPTGAGYTLVAYIDGDSDVLVGESREINGAMKGSLGKLGENTWGVATTRPDSQGSETWQGLPMGLENAMTIKETNSATSAGDETSLYYGTYVTPDMPHGVYDGVIVQYVAVANPTEDRVTVRFHGNGTKFAPGLEEEMANWGADEYAMLKEEYDGDAWQYILRYPTVSDVNVVEYVGDCEEAYIGKTPKISKTSNINSDEIDEAEVIRLCNFESDKGQYDIPYMEESGRKVEIGLDDPFSIRRESWTAVLNGVEVSFYSEEEIIKYLNENSDQLQKTGLDLYLSANRIMYDGNGATGGTMDGFVTNTSYEYRIEMGNTRLIAPNFYKDGYGFAGWSTDKDATVGGNSRIYGPSEDISEEEFDFGGTHSVTMYAVWVPSAGNLQNWNGCGALDMGAVTALTDVRDGNVYTVGKMADGNCWMMENLRLRAENSGNASLAQGYGGVFEGLANSENENFGTEIPNSKYGANNIIGDKLNERIPRYNHNNSSVGDESLMDSPRYGDYVSRCKKCRWYDYGNYYTFAAANATTEKMDIDSYGAEDTSICPAGWSLPSYDQSEDAGDFNYLDTQLGGSDDPRVWTKYPINIVPAGFWAEYDYYHPGGGRENSAVFRSLIGAYLASNRILSPSGQMLLGEKGLYIDFFLGAIGGRGFEFDYVNAGVSVRCLMK